MDTNTTPHATPNGTGGDDHGTTRTAFRVAAAGVALVLIATLALIGASPASAEYPPTSKFVPEFIAPGGYSYADVHCDLDLDDGESATVYVTHDGGAEKGYGFLIGSNGPGTFRIEASSDGDNHVIDTDLAGTWSVKVECPSYWTLTLELRVITPTLDVVPRLDLDHNCATVDDIAGIKVGAGNIVCFTVTNHTGRDIRKFIVSNAGNQNGGVIPAGELPDGGSWTTFAGDDRWLDPAGETLTNLSAWAQLEEVSGVIDYVTSPALSVVVPPANPALDLRTTVSLGEMNSCAVDGGGSESLTVAAGTEVWVCYQMTNLTLDDFDLHYLSGPAVGSLLDADAFELGPNEFRRYRVKLNPTEDIDLTATWTGANTSHKVSFDDTDGATIDVEGEVPPADDDVPTTTTTAPVDDPAEEEQGTTTTTAAPATTSTVAKTNAEVEAITAQPKYAG